MTKTKKIILISSTIILVIVGVLMFSKRFRILLGMLVPYTFSDGSEVKLQMGSYGGKSSRIISVYDLNDSLIGNIYKENGVIKFMKQSGVTNITNPDDSKFFNKFL